MNEKHLNVYLIVLFSLGNLYKATAGSQSCLCSNCIIKARSPRGLTVSGFHKIPLFQCNLERIFAIFPLIAFLKKISYLFSIVPDLAVYRFPTKCGLESRHSF